jgi:N6-L-threonylcarbamoyladenine synthase
VDYQNCEQFGFWNVREYVLHRDGHICQHCKGKSKDSILEVHHLKSSQIGGDRPDNLITLCSKCHLSFRRVTEEQKLVSKGELKLKIKASIGLKAETFMTMVSRNKPLPFFFLILNFMLMWEYPPRKFYEKF